MSDYTVSDKVEGNPWSPADHNAMKLALNSKQDRSNMVNNMSSPSANTYPTTAALAAYAVPGETFKYRGELEGSENLNTLTLPGYYVPKQFFPPSLHESYPEEAPPGVLKVYPKVGNAILQEYTVVDKEALVIPGAYYRTYDGFSEFWGPWRKYASQDWANDTFSPVPLPPGEPTITAATGVTLSLDIGGGCTDLRGLISFVNNTGATLDPGTLITIEFEYERDGLKSIQLTGHVQSALNVTPYSPPSNTQALIRIDAGLADGQGGAFYYHIS